MNWLTWALLSAVFAGATAVLAKIGVSGVNSHLATAIRTTVVLVFAWSLVWVADSACVRGIGSLSGRTWYRTFVVLLCPRIAIGRGLTGCAGG